MAEEPKRDPVRSLSNRIFLKISGKWFRAYSIVRHVGRTSGRQYRNPVSAYPLGDGFVIAVLYGGVELGRQRRAGRHRGPRPAALTNPPKHDPGRQVLHAVPVQPDREDRVPRGLRQSGSDGGLARAPGGPGD